MSRMATSSKAAILGLLLAAGSPLCARVFLTVDEALKLAFPGAQVERRTAYLTPEQLKRARQLGQVEVPSALVTYYAATREAKPAGTAYFDTHLVRTLPETVLVIVDPQGKVARVEVSILSAALRREPILPGHLDDRSASASYPLSPNPRGRPVPRPVGPNSREAPRVWHRPRFPQDRRSRRLLRPREPARSVGPAPAPPAPPPAGLSTSWGPSTSGTRGGGAFPGRCLRSRGRRAGAGAHPGGAAPRAGSRPWRSPREPGRRPPARWR